MGDVRAGEVLGPGLAYALARGTQRSLYPGLFKKKTGRWVSESGCEVRAGRPTGWEHPIGTKEVDMCLSL